MPEYFYTAKSLKGEQKAGTKEAADQRDLARILRQEGYILISAVSEKEKAKKKGISFAKLFESIGPVSLTEMMTMTRNLQVMISAGVALPRALNILSVQTKNRKLAKALKKVRDDVLKGKSFAESLAAFPKIFPEVFYNIVKVGEESGTLEEVLTHLTAQMEREHELRTKIKGAMIYPLIIILAMLGIGVLMLVMVVPQLADVFEDLEVELPLTTRIVMNSGNFLAQRWYLVILFVIIIAFLFYSLIKTKKGKRAIDNFLLKVPVISRIIKKANSAYVVRTLSNLISSGVPLVRSLEVISGATGNFFYKTALKQAAQKVQKGEKLSQALTPYPDLFPVMVVQMIEVGEETGETASILAKLAKFFEQAVANATKNLAAVIEPVLLLVIGGAIAFFAISMLQPIYSVLGSI